MIVQLVNFIFQILVTVPEVIDVCFDSRLCHPHFVDEARQIFQGFRVVINAFMQRHVLNFLGTQDEPAPKNSKNADDSIDECVSIYHHEIISSLWIVSDNMERSTFIPPLYSPAVEIFCWTP